MKKLIAAILTCASAGIGQTTYSPGKIRVTDSDGAVLMPYSAPSNHVSMANSTTNLLTANSVFTGTAESMTGHGYVYVNVYADVASGTDGLSVQQSPDGVNWDNTDEYTVPAGSGKTYAFQAAGEFLRVVYSNGAAGQSDFRLQTKYLQIGKPSSHRIQDAIVEEDDGELVKAVLTAKMETNGFINITATDSGNLKVANVEDGLAIAKGDVAGTTFIHKFGEAPNFDAADGIVTVWDGAADGAAYELMRYVYSSTNNIDSVISSSASDIGPIEIQGLDVNWVTNIQTVTMSGQTRAALTTPLRRVFRMKNTGSSNFVGIISCYITNSPTSSGVVTENADVRAIINDGNNQTLMAVYTVPAGKTGYMRDWYASVAGANKSSNYKTELYARPFGGVFQLKHRSSISDGGTSYLQHRYTEPEVFGAKTDIEIRVVATAVGVTAADIAAGFDIALVDD